MTAKNLARLSISFTTILAVKGAPAVKTKPTTNPVLAAYARPLSFEPNRGQADKQTDFLVHGVGYSLVLSRGEAAILLQRGGRANPNSAGATALRMQAVGANLSSAPDALDLLASQSNYFVGNVPEKWHANIPNYAKVRYANVYPGVDLLYYGNQRQLEYDFVVSPGADPNRILLDFEGATKTTLDHEGNVVMHTAAGDLRWHKPIAYQEANGTRKMVLCAYARRGADRFAFTLQRYDRTKPLIIDPVLEYSTYLGGTFAENGAQDRGISIAVDSKESSYVTGWTVSFDFPTKNPYQTAPGGGHTANAFVTKFDSAGNLVYSTYLGGSGNEFPFSGDFGDAITVDDYGHAYVAGLTSSSDFPTKNAFQNYLKAQQEGFNAFVTKLDRDGDALIYSTYLGGSGAFNAGDAADSIAVDKKGHAYVTGFTFSTDFPTKNAFQNTSKITNGQATAFVTKLDRDGDALVYSTYLGGSGSTSSDLFGDIGSGIRVDAEGHAYVAGSTESADFPVKNSFQPNLKGTQNAFVTKLDRDGDALVYSTYLGGTGTDGANAIALDVHGKAYITGFTSSADFPVRYAIQPTLKGAQNAFVTKLDRDGDALLHSTYLGGSGSDAGYGIAVDWHGDAYVTGSTSSSDFPINDAFQSVYGGNGDAFVTKLDHDGDTLVYSSYLGGTQYDQAWAIAVDCNGNAYVTGNTSSTDFPLMNAFQNINNDGDTAFVTKIKAK